MAKKPTEEAEAPVIEQITEEQITEEQITAKVRAGLTRAQAIEVITNQRLHDAALAKG